MADLVSTLTSFINRPRAFVMFAYPWGKAGSPLANHVGPDTWQNDVLLEMERALASGESLAGTVRIAVKSGHGPGKTALISWIVHWFMSTRHNSRAVVTANTKNQLHNKTWAELAKWWQMSVHRDMFVHTATRFMPVNKDLAKNWFAEATPWSEHNSEAFAGTHAEFVLYVFDEASRIADKIWEVSEGAMTTTKSWWFAFGNPTQNTGRFYECWNRFKHRWHTLTVDTRTCKMANKKQIQEWIDDYGEDDDFVRVRVRGEFPRSSIYQLIPVDTVEAAMKRPMLEPPQLAQFTKILSVDVARHGNAQSVWCRRQGIAVFPLVAMRSLDLMQTAGHTAEIIREWEPNACFVDATGMGWGVVDRLTQLSYNPIGIQSAAAALKRSEYSNKRAEMWCGVRDWLRNDAILPFDEELKSDLTGPEYQYDAQNRLRLEKKEDMERRGLPSPDKGDALAGTFYEQVEHTMAAKKESGLQKVLAAHYYGRRSGTTWMSR